MPARSSGLLDDLWSGWLIAGTYALLGERLRHYDEPNVSVAMLTNAALSKILGDAKSP